MGVAGFDGKTFRGGEHKWEASSKKHVTDMVAKPGFKYAPLWPDLLGTLDFHVAEHIRKQHQEMAMKEIFNQINQKTHDEKISDSCRKIVRDLDSQALYVSAATSIQASVRGFLVRRRLWTLQAGESTEPNFEIFGHADTIQNARRDESDEVDSWEDFYEPEQKGTGETFGQGFLGHVSIGDVSDSRGHEEEKDAETINHGDENAGDGVGLESPTPVASGLVEPCVEEAKQDIPPASSCEQICTEKLESTDTVTVAPISIEEEVSLKVKSDPKRQNTKHWRSGTGGRAVKAVSAKAKEVTLGSSEPMVSKNEEEKAGASSPKPEAKVKWGKLKTVTGPWRAHQQPERKPSKVDNEKHRQSTRQKANNKSRKSLPTKSKAQTKDSPASTNVNAGETPGTITNANAQTHPTPITIPGTKSVPQIPEQEPTPESPRVMGRRSRSATDLESLLHLSEEERLLQLRTPTSPIKIGNRCAAGSASFPRVRSSRLESALTALRRLKSFERVPWRSYSHDENTFEDKRKELAQALELDGRALKAPSTLQGKLGNKPGARPTEERKTPESQSQMPLDSVEVTQGSFTRLQLLQQAITGSKTSEAPPNKVPTPKSAAPKQVSNAAGTGAQKRWSSARPPPARTHSEQQGSGCSQGHRHSKCQVDAYKWEDFTVTDNSKVRVPHQTPRKNLAIGANTDSTGDLEVVPQFNTSSSISLRKCTSLPGQFLSDLEYVKSPRFLGRTRTSRRRTPPGDGGVHQDFQETIQGSKFIPNIVSQMSRPLKHTSSLPTLGSRDPHRRRDLSMLTEESEVGEGPEVDALLMRGASPAISLGSESAIDGLTWLKLQEHAHPTPRHIAEILMRAASP
ncbi:hypothetical protein BSKO_00124 [Bryopsis sp. KO-2023]|nr:hypothetical protein BSKO_00124 [Bryopsis sp. KO-2023]